MDKYYIKNILEIKDVVHCNKVFQPIIHLGWALMIEHEETQNFHIAESLAFLVTTAFPVYKFEDRNFNFPESGLDRPASESSEPWVESPSKRSKPGGAELLQRACHPLREDTAYISAMVKVGNMRDTLFMDEWPDSVEEI